MEMDRRRRLERSNRRCGPLLLAATCVATLWIALISPGPEPARAQIPQPSLESAQEIVEVDPVSPAEIARRRKEVEAEIASTRKELETARVQVARTRHAKRLEMLEDLAALLARQTEIAQRIGAQEPGEPTPSQDAAPSPFALEGLLERQFDQEEEEAIRATTRATRRDALARAREALARADRTRREAQSQLDAAVSDEAREAIALDLEEHRLARRAAEERVHLRTLELTEVEQESADESPTGALADQITRMRQALRRGEGDSTAGFTDLRQREAELRQHREAIQRRLSTAELQLEAARNRFARAAEPPVEMLEELEMLTARRDARQKEIEIVDARLHRLAGQHEIWRDWEAVLRNTATRQEIDASKEAIADRIQELEQNDLERASAKLDLERRIEALERRIRTLAPNAPLKAILEEKRTILIEQLELVRQDTADLARDRRFSARVLADVRKQSGEGDLLENLARTARAIRSIWTYEITIIDDSPITVGSVLLAFLLAAAGLWASKRGAGLVGSIAKNRFRLEAGATHALETICFYLLLISFILFALRAVHFPLTAFTVLGGALAIGIGFGSQNVMNNFISGLILMLERPVRAGDVVEIDGNHGTVERIGARSTRIRSTDGRQIIVPNSFFLESNVVNWTLSDDLIRTCVVVGVVYGSPTRLVESLIRRVVDEEESILDNPAPILLFSEFGDNSLNFEIHFWVRARAPMQRRIVESSVRFHIDDLFREHSIVIAFPQRDVHVDSVAPIEVRLLDNDGSAESEKKDAEGTP